MDNLLKDGERIDDIGFGTLRLIQKPEDFCYGIDAVLLATSAEIRKGARIIDLGTGTGIVPLILSHRTEAAEIFGVELQQDSYERALRNVAINDLEGRVRFLHGDVKLVPEENSSMVRSFDAVFTNPPYVKGGAGLRNMHSVKTIARHETTAELEDFIRTASFLLKDKGEFYMVHRPNRLVDICTLCRQYRLEPKELRLVCPDKETAPNILLIRCVKHGRSALKFKNPLYVYKEDGSYTDEIMELYERR
jgi:tRNA1Val (adenine37-N6)-methyltransferase